MLERFRVEVVTAAKARALVPVATLRAELGLPDTSQDAKLARLIAAMSAAFEGQSGLKRPLVRQTYREHTNGLGGAQLPLSNRPIESVSVVEYGIDETDLEEIAASEYSIAGRRRGFLYRILGWPEVRLQTPTSAAAGAELYHFHITYVAGWVPPGSGPGLVSTWAADTVMVENQFVKPAAAANGHIDLLYEATGIAGDGKTHATTEPTWPTTVGATVVDDAVTWTARAARELPADIQEVAILTAAQWFEGALDVPVGVESESADGFQVSYDAAAIRDGVRILPSFARSVLEGYR